MVHLSGLDVSEVAGLRVVVPRRSEPSPVYQGAWEEIERARQIKGWELTDDKDKKPMKPWAGFVRASWFSYRRRGNIPLSAFARLLSRLGLKYRLEVLPAKGYVRPRVALPGGEMPQDTEEARQAANAINAITDPGVRAKLALKVVSAALEYKHRPPLDPPVPAEQQTE